MEVKVKAFIEKIRPYIQSHGGDVEFISMAGNVVNLKLHGACHSCPHAMQTLHHGIEAQMQEEIAPELTVQRVG